MTRREFRWIVVAGIVLVGLIILASTSRNELRTRVFLPPPESASPVPLRAGRSYEECLERVGDREYCAFKFGEPSPSPVPAE